jgi:HEAT repeat protein
MTRSYSWMLLAAVWCLTAAAPAAAYVDLAPTLARVIRESQTITVAEVERFNPDKGTIVLKKVRDLKGESGADALKHQLLRANEAAVDRPILEWAEPGRRCVLFVTGKTAVVCVGEGWYQATATDDGWSRIGPPRPDLALAYYGTLSRLADAVPLITAGKSAVITTLPHGADHEGASFDLALNRAGLPGLVKVQRLRANLRMPDIAFGVGSNPAIVVGQGRAGKDDVAALREYLKSNDATVRAETAADLGFLGLAADAAAADLVKLLDDQSPVVCLNAASALLRVKPEEKRAALVLRNGLVSEDAATRRQSARAAGLAGPAAAPLAEKLAALLNDSDRQVRRLALQALATLGPAAAKALEAVTALLDQRDTAIDAADALGRMGPAARPALKALARLLTGDAATERWAAVRAMAQIGGDDAAPAVQFMIDELPKASEIDGYNMLIYLSLLGPVAKDALPAVRNARVRNPILRMTTAWAINPGADLPWLGPMGENDVARYILEGYIHELGDHLKPVAKSLAKKIMAGTAGDVPTWGYKLLARFPEESLAVLTPGLADMDLTLRERAAVALGYMGRAAAAAKPQVAQALKTAENEREERLLRWCLRELEP